MNQCLEDNNRQQRFKTKILERKYIFIFLKFIIYLFIYVFMLVDRFIVIMDTVL